jgi:hypothetical protein
VLILGQHLRVSYPQCDQCSLGPNVQDAQEIVVGMLLQEKESL